MSDDLTSALRDLAADHRTPPPVPGAEIRRRAEVRGRRRRVAAAGATLVTAAVAVTVAAGLTTGSGSDDERPHRKPAPVATDSARTPAATVDLSRHRMTLDGRELPISAGTAAHPTPTGAMTVVATHRKKRMPAGDFGLGEYDLTLPWVVELRTPDGGTNYVVALTYNEKAPGKTDVTKGWIGLRPDDARTLHDRLEPGDVITVRAGGPAR
ncbi:L,D-transpeptidase [Streptomyces atriruber]|uniref:L,D-transpeptidase n=1 Tax=Streptomyces atriruber TaxID=545121 RepID=UPI000AAC1511|nr:L,D-transpeptidase [Streptomyces atriruber]